ncbi:MAG: hypothetical protein U0792_14020 [Gemmataceae bacterium]
MTPAEDYQARKDRRDQGPYGPWLQIGLVILCLLLMSWLGKILTPHFQPQSPPSGSTQSGG